MERFKIRKNSTAGAWLDAVATVFFGLALLTGFVCLVAGMMYPTDAPRETWTQTVLMAAMFSIMVYVLGVQVLGFMDSEQGPWSPWRMTAMILYSWMPIQAIVFTWLMDPESPAYWTRLFPIMVTASLLFAFMTVSILDSLYKGLARMLSRSRRDDSPSQPGS